MKPILVHILLTLTLLLAFQGSQWAGPGEEPLKFEENDTLEEIREKISYNKYNFEVSHNWVFDMPADQKKIFFSRRAPLERSVAVSDDIGPLADHLGKKTLPTSFDWRNYQGQSYIGPIRNQGSCGSCYAFGACAAAEGTYNYAAGRYGSNCVDFSESFIMWCLGDLPAYYWHFYGCDGADYDYYELQALVDYGIINESYFPYQTYPPSSCTHMNDPRITFKGWYRVPCGDINAIKTAIMTYGVVDAAINVTNAFEAYSSGIYQDTQTGCYANPCYYTPTNHSIGLVGWNDDEGVFILRNSWGKSWGENGYMRIKYTAARVSCEVCYLVYSTTTTKSLRVTSPNGGENWTAGSTRNITWTSTGSVGNVKIQYSVNNGSNWTTIVSSTANDGSYSWKLPNTDSSQCRVRIMEASTGSPSDTSDAVFSITTGGGLPASISLNRNELDFTSVAWGSHTGTQQIWINNSGSGILNWNVSDNAWWLSCSPTSGSNAGVINVSVNPSGLGAGFYIGTITVSSANAANSPQTAAVYLTVINASQDQPPFGTFSTPINNSTARSSIPVTGWVLDDVQVERVEIYNGSSFIGNAVFVEGARPDIEQAYPGYPKNYLAGWGYMLLTNFLPNNGNGTFTLYAEAVDSGGNREILGAKTIYCKNASAVKPFGAIDAPAQGGMASGNSFANWGWALTPQPNKIPTDGSTINVWVDGVSLGHPTYNIYRSDIADLFPSYANSKGAVGYFYLDTTNYDNGVHVIQWTANDNAGNTDGIGSRYFTIQNTGGDARSEAQRAENRMQTEKFGIDLSQIPVDHLEPVEIKKGYRLENTPQTIHPDENGTINIQIKELERVEIELGRPGWTGFLLVGNQLRPLPPGSTVSGKKGIFYWQPGPGFIGNYQLVFIHNENRLRKINITIMPKNNF